MAKHTKTKQVSFRFTPKTREALEFIKERDGIPLSEQLRRAVAMFIGVHLADPARGRPTNWKPDWLDTTGRVKGRAR
jgi:hypothetical protein